MSEYTPIDADIRTAWMVHHIDGTNESPMPMNEWESEFDRWLAEHDRVVAERAWDEGHLVHGEDYRHNGHCRHSLGCIAVNPYHNEQENNNA